MKSLTFGLFDTFECTGSACSDNCCLGGWAINIDDAHAKMYLQTKGALGAQLANAMIECDGKFYIRLKDGKCPFLNEQNLCSLYLQHGSDKMCDVCRLYPRVSWQCGDLVFHSLTLSCPEAARLILSEPSIIPFDFAEDNSNIMSDTEENWKLFNILINAMTLSVNIMQNRSFSTLTRLRLMISFNSLLQQSLASNSDIDIIFNAFSDEQELAFLAENSIVHQTNSMSLLSFALDFYKHSHIFHNPEFIQSYIGILPQTLAFCSSKLEQPLSNDFWDSVCVDHYETRYEQYSVYYLTRYYMDSYIKNKNIHQIIANFVFLFCLHRLFAFGVYQQKGDLLTLDDLIPIYTNISRFFEHSYTNLDTMYQLFESLGMTDSATLLSLI